MNSDGHPEFQQKIIRSAKIIAGALIAGPTVFLAVAASIAANNQPGPLTLPYMGAGVAVMMIVMSFVIPNLSASSMIRKIQTGDFPIAQSTNQATTGIPEDATPADLLHCVFMQRLIIGNALIEGAVFLNVTAYMTSSLWWSAAIAVALIAIMAVTFPTESRVRHWVDDQLQLMNLEQ